MRTRCNGAQRPEQYGGLGRNLPATFAVLEEIAQRSTTLALIYIMCTCYAGMNLLESASEEQKQLYLPRIASGELLFHTPGRNPILEQTWLQ